MKHWQKLEQLKKKGPKNKEEGICLNVVFDVSISYQLKKTSWFGWEKFSGVSDAPVPHDWCCPVAAVISCPLWDKRTRYGKLRWELVDHLIAEFKKRDL